MYTLHDTYTTQSQAETFVRTFNTYVGQGRIASWDRVGQGQYRVWLTI